MSPRPSPGDTTAGAIYRVITDSDAPVLTANDIAEQLDVSKPTVFNNIEEVEKDPDIHKREIGQSFVYWYEPKGSTEFDYRTNLGIPVADLNLLEFRAKYFQSKSLAHDHLEESESPQEVRAVLWDVIHDYLVQSQLSRTVALDRSAVDEGERPEYTINESLSWAQTMGDDLEYYAFEHHFFTSEWFGEVRGIAGLKAYNSKRRFRLYKIAAGGEIPDPTDEDAEADIDQSRITAQDLDEIYPSFSQLLGVGETIDHLVTTTWGINW